MCLFELPVIVFPNPINSQLNKNTRNQIPKSLKVFHFKRKPAENLIISLVSSKVIGRFQALFFFHTTMSLWRSSKLPSTHCPLQALSTAAKEHLEKWFIQQMEVRQQRGATDLLWRFFLNPSLRTGSHKMMGAAPDFLHKCLFWASWITYWFHSALKALLCQTQGKPLLTNPFPHPRHQISSSNTTLGFSCARKI